VQHWVEELVAIDSKMVPVQFVLC